MTPHPVIREYYACFNERRLADAVDLFAHDAVLEHPGLGHAKHGREHYLQLAQMWARVFPDGQLAVEGVQQRDDTIYEVDLIGTGTHLGDFNMDGYGTFKATGAWATLRFRELFEIRDGKIAYLGLTLDIHDFVRQLGDPNSL